MLSVTDRYLARQVISGTIFAVVLLCLVLVLGNIFKEIRPLLVEKGASIGLLGKFILYIFPFSLVFTIPWGFLASVLLVFGRLSSDQEIIGFRSSGRSLYRIALPVLISGALFSALCLWTNGSIAPRAKSAHKQLLYEALKDNPLRLLDPGIVDLQDIRMVQQPGGMGLVEK